MASNEALEIGDAYFQAWNERAWDRMRALLAPDLSRVTPYTAFDSADSFMERTLWLAPKFVRLELFAKFSCGAQACFLYDFRCVPPLGDTTTAELLEVAGGRIVTMRVIFDPRPFIQPVEALLARARQ